MSNRTSFPSDFSVMSSRGESSAAKALCSNLNGLLCVQVVATRPGWVHHCDVTL